MKNGNKNDNTRLLAQGQHAHTTFLPSVEETRKTTVKRASELGEMEFTALCTMMEGEDPFANAQAKRIADAIEETIMLKKIEMHIVFELKENYKATSIMPNPQTNRCVITVHEKCLLDDADNLRMFSSRAELVAYYNALAKYIMTLLDDTGYILTSRPVFRDAKNGAGEISFAGSKGASAPPRYTSNKDLPDDFHENYGFRRPDIAYGKETDLYVSWGDEDFYERLQLIDSAKQYDGIERGIPLEDIVHLSH